jgi:hypothetical protein
MSLECLLFCCVHSSQRLTIDMANPIMVHLP